MGNLIKLAAWLLMELSRAGSARAMTKRLAVAAVCGSLAALLVLAAIGCLAAALWNFTLPSLGPVGAPLVVAGAMIVAALILALAIWLVMRAGRSRPGDKRAIEMLTAEVTRLFNENKSAVLMAAAIAGMFAASRGGKSRSD